MKLDALILGTLVLAVQGTAAAAVDASIAERAPLNTRDQEFTTIAVKPKPGLKNVLPVSECPPFLKDCGSKIKQLNVTKEVASSLEVSCQYKGNTEEYDIHVHQIPPHQRILLLTCMV
jgi:hypothetical protein